MDYKSDEFKEFQEEERVRLLGMMSSEGMAMRAGDRVRLEDWEKEEKEVRCQGEGGTSWMDTEITKNYSRDSYWMLLEEGVVQNGARLLVAATGRGHLLCHELRDYEALGRGERA